MIYRIPIVLLFLTLITWIPRIQGDPFMFETYIECHESIANWCGDYIIYEEDDYDHDILETHQFCTNQTSQSYSDQLYPNGDFGFEYEFKYKLKHNCSSDGQERCIQLERRLDMPKALSEIINWNITAFNSGRLECLPDGL